MVQVISSNRQRCYHPYSSRILSCFLINLTRRVVFQIRFKLQPIWLGVENHLQTQNTRIRRINHLANTVLRRNLQMVQVISSNRQRCYYSYSSHILSHFPKNLARRVVVFQMHCELHPTWPSLENHLQTKNARIHGIEHVVTMCCGGIDMKSSNRRICYRPYMSHILPRFIKNLQDVEKGQANALRNTNAVC